MTRHYAIVVALFVSCSGSDHPTHTVPVASVVISPSTIGVSLHLSTPLTATSKDAQGNTLPDRRVTWASSDASVATVSSNGLVTGVAVGTATISATSEGISGSGSVRVVPFLIVSRLTVGAFHTCGLTSLGIAYCWGENAFGAIGDSTTNNHRVAPTAVSRGLVFNSVVAGLSFTCGLSSRGEAYCWGSNAFGKLGDGTSTSRPFPAAVIGGRTFASLVAGGDHICGLTASGAAYCWGRNSEGQLGDGTTTNRSSPVPVSGGLTFIGLAASRGVSSVHTCGLTPTGSAYCWGDNSIGEIGDGTSANRRSPAAVSGGLTFRLLTSGDYYSCGVTGAGAAYCWGNNDGGRLGDSTLTNRSVPVAVAGGLAFDILTAGASHTCGLTVSGVAYCWGHNLSGELGIGAVTVTNRPSPAAVTGGLTFNSLTAGTNHTCGLTSGGEAYCWGLNAVGELGDGTFFDRAEPTRVRSP